jgi:hypothetical protein
MIGFEINVYHHLLAELSNLTYNNVTNLEDCYYVSVGNNTSLSSCNHAYRNYLS